jgi:hypothetical protein
MATDEASMILEYNVAAKLAAARMAKRTSLVRRDGRVVDGGGLENHCTGNGTGGSNPSLSANHHSLMLAWCRLE